MKRWLLILILAVGCSRSSDKIKVAATSVPHAEILKEAQKQLRGEGVDLKIIEVDDYTTPNRLLSEKQVDANFFQHRPYLEKQQKRFGYRIRELTAVHLEPLRIYSSKISKLEDLPNGAKVALPSDPTNEARALFLLESYGLICLDCCAFPTVCAIQDNPLKLRFEELDAPLLPRSLRDVTIAIIPSNFALQAGLKESQVIAKEKSDSPYVNVVAVRESDDRQELEKLRQALESEKVREFIQQKYKGTIIPLH